ncbi:MAG: phosphatase PAP2 family protein [Spirochaetales bacterium]|nr:phosphatase PAP2 family protein [Candidatus Physcosoma equi]
MNNLWNKRNHSNSISLDSLFLAVFILLYKFLVYDTSRLLAVGIPHDLSTPYEDLVPLIPGFIYIYFGSYLFWVVNYFLSLKEDKCKARAFAAADSLGETVAFFCFVFFPCTMVRPEIQGTGSAEKLLLFLYKIDGPDNLFPSLHCFNSILAFLGIYRNPKIKKGYKVFSLLFALLVCASTLFVKQHVLVDTLFGMLLAPLSYGVGKLLFQPRKEKEN